MNNLEFLAPSEFRELLQKNTGVEISVKQLRDWGNEGFLERIKKNGTWHYHPRDFDKAVKIRTILSRKTATFEDVRRELHIADIVVEYDEHQEEMRKQQEQQALANELVAAALQKTGATDAGEFQEAMLDGFKKVFTRLNEMGQAVQKQAEEREERLLQIIEDQKQAMENQQREQQELKALLKQQHERAEERDKNVVELLREMQKQKEKKGFFSRFRG